MTSDLSTLRQRFRALHDDGIFVIPNPWDVGSARILEHLGFAALATTSSGFAATLGRLDQRTSRDELVEHVAAICAAVDIPVNVDAEHLFADQPGGVARTVELLAAAGASGVSIEDFDPVAGALTPIEAAAALVGEAAEVARRHRITLTARAENHLYGVNDLDDTVTRLRAYRAAGAEVTYAPGLLRPEDIRMVVDSVGGAVNVLAMAGAPPVAGLAELGVRRVSTGGSLAWAAYGRLVEAAEELRDRGTTGYLDQVIPRAMRSAALG